MDDQPLDLSALDRHADPMRYRRQVIALAAAALKPAPHPFLLEFMAWSRGAVAVGAILALVTWLPVWTAARPAQATASSSEDPVLQVAAWAQAGAIPSDANLLAIAGAPDAR
jgi:negative regulator of sigma E activity